MHLLQLKVLHAVRPLALSAEGMNGGEPGAGTQIMINDQPAPFAGRRWLRRSLRSRMRVIYVCNSEREESMPKIIIGFVAIALAGCGVETATTAVTGAAIKKQEVEEGKKTMTQVENKVGQAVDQMQQRAEKDADK